MSNPLKEKLGSGDVCIGAWLSVPSPLVAEPLAACGFHWMCVDLEHSPIDEAGAIAAFIAAERRGAAPVVRLPSADPYLARRMLDGGAQGLIVPVTESADAFADFASHCLYPPAGRRGTGLSRANTWGETFDDYRKNFNPVLIPQIETRAGAEAAGEIAGLDVVDAIFIGPYDLSADLGKSGDFTTPEYEAAIAAIKQACVEQGKTPGIHQVAPDFDQLMGRFDEGYRLLAVATDMIAMRRSFAGLKDFIADAR